MILIFVNLAGKGKGILMPRLVAMTGDCLFVATITLAGENNEEKEDVVLVLFVLACTGIAVVVDDEDDECVCIKSAFVLCYCYYKLFWQVRAIVFCVAAAAAAAA